jgi:ubiquinone/menaquinone biosynthesis C-methylase UbiE
MQPQQENNQAPQNKSPHTALVQLINGYWNTQLIYVAAKLGIADLLKDGSLSCEELASKTETNAQSVYRLMRALASVGLFAEENGYFKLTPVGIYLQSDIPGSVQPLAILAGKEHYRAWEDLLYSVQTGKSAFEHIYDMPVFDYYCQHPEAGENFDKAMTTGSVATNARVIKSYDFSPIRKLVDVGGGNGSFLTSVIKANPTMQGILFDLPSAIAGAKDLIAAEGMSKHCELVAGNYLESVPSGGDAYILKRIIHLWDDERALVILKNCHRAMEENGKLLVVELIIPPGDNPSFGKLMDIHMLVLYSGGRERSEVEYRALFEASGFELIKIVPTQSNLRVMEGIRV